MSENTKTELEKKYNTSKKYMRATEVAVYMSIGISTVWLYAKQGKITPKKLSARVTVFSIAEIDNFLNSDEVA